MQIVNYERAKQLYDVATTLANKVVIFAEQARSESTVVPAIDRVTPILSADVVSDSNITASIAVIGTTDYSERTSASQPSFKYRGRYYKLIIEGIPASVAAVNTSAAFGVCVEITISSTSTSNLDFNQIGISDDSTVAKCIMVENMLPQVIGNGSTKMRFIINF